MRTLDIASALFPKTRQKVLGVLVLSDGKFLHLREIARQAKLSVSGTREELNRLQSAGILLTERSGNQILFRLNPNCPVYPELRMIIVKTEGVASQIEQVVKKIKGIELAYIYGSFASGLFDSSSDIDLMVMGSVDPQKLITKLLPVEQLLNREINVKVYSKMEYLKQLKLKGSFISQVHNEDLITIIGDLNDIRKPG